jgi:acetyltransferase-like isoleucine patch superfamily enzyme
MPDVSRMMAEARSLVSEPGRRVVLRGQLLAPYWRRRFHSFGDGAILDRPFWLYGAKKISIGDQALILKGSWLSAERATWDNPDPALVIGQGVTIRQGVTISASESIVIEDYVGIGGGSTILDGTHTHAPAAAHATRGEHENVLHNPMETAPVRIGRGSWLGDRVTVLMGANIGAHCTIGSNSVVRGDVPDYGVAIGVPARVVGTTRT